MAGSPATSTPKSTGHFQNQEWLTGPTTSRQAAHPRSFREHFLRCYIPIRPGLLRWTHSDSTSSPGNAT